MIAHDTAPRSLSKESRLAVVDVVRTVSILLVIACHVSRALPTGDVESTLVRGLWERFAPPGYYGVLLFFVVSGFLITRTTLQRAPSLAEVSVRRFYVRRVGRIVPLLVVSVAMGAVLMMQTGATAVAVYHPQPSDAYGPLFFGSIATFSFNWLRSFAARPDFGLHWDILWSLSVEEQFYLAFPWVVRAARSRERLAKVLAFAILQGPLARMACYFFAPRHPYLLVTNSFGAFELIAIGALVALFEDDVAAFLRARPWVARFAVLYGVTSFFVAYSNAVNNPQSLILLPTFMGVSTALVILGGMELPVFQSKIWVVPMLPGKLSYGMYLLHPTILWALWGVLRFLDAPTAFVLVALATVLVAFVVFHVYEQPANRLVRRRIAAAPRPVEGGAPVLR